MTRLNKYKIDSYHVRLSCALIYHYYWIHRTLYCVFPRRMMANLGSHPFGTGGYSHPGAGGCSTTVCDGWDAAAPTLAVAASPFPSSIAIPFSSVLATNGSCTTLNVDVETPKTSSMFLCPRIWCCCCIPPFGVADDALLEKFLANDKPPSSRGLPRPPSENDADAGLAATCTTKTAKFALLVCHR